MKRFMSLGVGLSIVVCAVAVAAAQAPAQDAQKAKTVTVTGCLAKGADATSFTLNDAMPGTAEKEQSKEAPKSTEMRSYRVSAPESLKLEGHVGHRITLTGTVEEAAAGSATPGAAGTAGTAGGGKPTATLAATSMKHISPTCTQ
ncbi:MAG TPA: hypothetical protein VFT47_01385 [Vicinamibacterales bacterium]|nr:hypothetical protein [Vicinamibacterales bacterium]